MDLATMSGLFLGITIIFAALLAGHVPIRTVIQPEAFLIVFGGTMTAVLIQFSFRQIQDAGYALTRAFYEEEDDTHQIVEEILDAATYCRTRGLLAIEPVLKEMDNPTLRQGLQMIVDNQPGEHIEAQIATQMEIQYKTDLQDARVFEAAGGFAPTMGIIGAIVGLVQIMDMFHSPTQLGHGVGNAFIATLYGVGSANLFLLPIAGKLKQRAKSQWFIQSLILQGVLAIRHGEHPMMIREKLSAYLSGEEADTEQGEPGHYAPEPLGVSL